MLYKYTSLEAVFSKLTRDATSNFDEGDVTAWTGEALEAMSTPRSCEEAVAFIEVINHQASIPAYCHSITQIARNNNWTPTNKCVTPAQVITETQNIFYQNCGDCGENQYVDMGYVVLDGRGTPLVEYDIAYYRPYFDLLGEYYGWSNSMYYSRCYTPVRLANSSFFNGLVDMHCDGGLYSSCRDEYTIVNKTVLRFNFDCGFVAVAYKRQAMDYKTGYPLIPDTYAHMNGIVSYIKFRIKDREKFSQREGAAQLAAAYETDWIWYCGQANNEEMMPFGEDENQNLLDQRSYLLPDNYKYYGYFGNLSTPESRRYNDPSGRNRRAEYITNGANYGNYTKYG